MKLYLADLMRNWLLDENLFSIGIQGLSKINVWGGKNELTLGRNSGSADSTNASQHTHTHNELISCRRAYNQERTISCSRGGWKDLCVLESYFYARNNKYFDELYSREVDLLLDSGAFTFITQNKKSVDWERYVREYAEFINRYQIRKFFELDIDSIVGLKEVERLRVLLEQLTGQQPIPVWHVSRGLDYFKQMCKKYPYVAYGGLMTDGFSNKKNEAAFPWFIKTAHEAGAKIHSLGYTPCDSQKFRQFRFDSADSTSWIAGNRFGIVYHFDANAGIMRRTKKPKGMRVKNLLCAYNNFQEWVKYSQYLKNI